MAGMPVYPAAAISPRQQHAMMMQMQAQATQMAYMQMQWMQYHQMQHHHMQQQQAMASQGTAQQHEQEPLPSQLAGLGDPKQDKLRLFVLKNSSFYVN